MEPTLKFDLFICAVRALAQMWTPLVIIDRETAITACHSRKTVVFDCEDDNRYIIISNTSNDSCSYGVLSTLDFLLGGDWAELPKGHFQSQLEPITLAEAMQSPKAYIYDVINFRITKYVNVSLADTTKMYGGDWQTFSNLTRDLMAQFVLRCS
jgi:hypothetical protein